MCKCDRTIVMKMLLLELLFLVSSVKGFQKFSSEPGDVVVKEGEAVRLDCVVSDKEGTLQWTKDDFGLGETRELAGFSRYRMVGVESDGEWHLEIRNVSLEDDGRYQCQVGATHTAGPIRSVLNNSNSGAVTSQTNYFRSRYAKLTVISTPQPPVITSGPYLVISEGQQTTVQCMSRGGKPAASLQWTINGENIDLNIRTHRYQFLNITHLQERL